jgi:hypothetical protein
MDPKDATLSPLTQIEAHVTSALRAKELAALEPLRNVERALVEYRHALEAHVAMEFAREHQFKQPAPSSRTPREAAELLLRAVNALAELRSADKVHELIAEPTLERASAAQKPQPEVPASLASLGHALASGPIVIVGGLARTDRLARIPEAVRNAIEWVDTARSGAHAIGNLAQRIRQKRVAGLVIIDGQVSHKHTDPLLAAAREVNLPAAYAGKGGQNALMRAIASLEHMLTPKSD